MTKHYKRSCDGVDRRTARIEIRIDKELDERIKKAAEYRGRTVADFLQDCMYDGLYGELDVVDEDIAVERGLETGEGRS